MGGINPAYEYVKACLEAGKSVCTSNKELVAKYWSELEREAKEKAEKELDNVSEEDVISELVNGLELVTGVEIKQKVKKA